MSASCELSILVARTDVSFMLRTIPHLVRACHFPFSRRVLVVDTAPLGPAYKNRPYIGSQGELRSCCEQLLRDGVVDEAVEINYSRSYRKRAYKKHFSSLMRHTHTCRGYPILGSIFSIEAARTEYVVHFDSDMLLYQDRNFSWIEEGIRLMRNDQDVVSVLPLSGPPTSDGTLQQQREVGEAYERDSRGFYRFKTFTSRVFLIDRIRFEQLLPLRLRLPLMTIIRNYFTNVNTLPPWEEMIGSKLEETPFVRVDLDSPLAWTLHPECRGPDFLNALPTIIKQVETGWYPPAQSGYYDVRLDEWLRR